MIREICVTFIFLVFVAGIGFVIWLVFSLIREVWRWAFTQGDTLPPPAPETQRTRPEFAIPRSMRDMK